jgi:hypothetical protein
MTAVINVDKVCRLCMEEAPLLLPIFKENLGYEGALLPHRIMALAAIQVNVISLKETRCELSCCHKNVFCSFIYM